MSIDTAENLKKPAKIVLDTNIIISGIGFHGNPRKILDSVLEGEIDSVISPILLAELEDVVAKKFPKLKDDLDLINKKIKKKFKIVKPTESLAIVRDDDDNRVLEAAVEGKCDYIVTGDRDLLDLKEYKKIKIVKPGEFLKLIEINGK